MNQLNAIGNIGKDAELRFLPNSTPVAQFSVAISSGYGEKKVTTWIRCSLFGQRAERLAPMLTKGSQIGVTGEVTNRPYTSNGVEKMSLELRVSEISLLGSRSEISNVHEPRTSDNPEQNSNDKVSGSGAGAGNSEDSRGSDRADGGQPAAQPAPNNNEPFDNFEDSIPF